MNFVSKPALACTRPPTLRLINYVFLSLLMGCLQNSFGMTSRLDSLKNVVETIPEDSLKCEVLLEIAKLQYNGQLAEDYSYRALALAKKLEETELIAKAYGGLGWSVGFDEVDKKTDYLDSAAELFTAIGNLNGLGSTYNTKAAILLEYNEFIAAKTNLEIALDYFQKSGNQNRQINVLGNLGIVLNQLDRPQEAISQYNRALEFLAITEPDNALQLARIYFGLGNSSTALQRFDEAADYFIQAYWHRHKEKSDGEAESLIAIAQLMYSAHSKGKDTLSIHTKINELGFTCSTALLDSAMVIALRSNRLSFIPSIWAAQRQHFLLHSNYEMAYKLLLREKTLNDTNKLSSASLEGFADLKTKYEKEKLQLELLEKEISNEKKQNQVNLLIFFLGVMALMLIIGLLLFQNRLKAKHLQLTKVQQEQQAIAMSAMLKGQEKERARIAMDLHDGLGNLLSSLRISVANMQSSSVDQTGALYYSRVNVMIDDACSEVRKIAHEMMPHALERLGLNKALEDLIANLNNTPNLTATLEIYGENRHLPDHSNLMIFRTIQEVINNIINHAKAKEVLLQLTYSESWLNLTIEDDGIGFEPNKIVPGSGMGLESIAFRIGHIGGEYEIDSRLMMGTLVSINVPLEYPEVNTKALKTSEND